MLIPADILDDVGVSVVNLENWINGIRELILAIDIPHTDSAVIAARKQKTCTLRVPIEAITLTFMAEENHVRSDFVVSRAGAVLEVVKDMNFADNCLCCDNFVHLWHVARSVNLSLVINLQFNLNALIFGQISATLGSRALTLTCG